MAVAEKLFQDFPTVISNFVEKNPISFPTIPFCFYFCLFYFLFQSTLATIKNTINNLAYKS